MAYLQALIGLVVLLAGGVALVRGSVGIALRFGVSSLAIGLTLVAFGTSAPELVASVNAALIGSPGIAVGNVVGSNIANTLLVLGLAAAIARIEVRAGSLRDGVALLASTALLLAVVLAGSIGRLVGVAFLALLAGYTIVAYRGERVHDGVSGPLRAGEEAARAARKVLPWRALLLVAVGIVALVAGARLLVGGSVAIARTAGVSEAVIGLTLVAIGTSLPELATSVIAAFRKETAIAFGNIVGSSVFNILGILGVTAIVRPLEVPREIAVFDIWVAGAATLALVFFSITGWRLMRREGAFFVAAYAIYLAFQLSPRLRSAIGIP